MSKKKAKKETSRTGGKKTTKVSQGLEKRPSRGRAKRTGEETRGKDAPRRVHEETRTRAWRALLPYWPLSAFLIIGLWFRLSTTLWEPVIFPDSLQYMHLAKEIRSGKIFSKDYNLDEGFIKSRRLPPFYSLLLSPFAAAESDLEKVGIVISLILSLLTMALVYLFMEKHYSRAAAVVSAWFLSFHSFVLWYSNTILSEATFGFLYAAVIAVSSFALVRPRVWLFAASGVLGSLLYLTRDVGITAAPLVALFGLVKLKFLDRASWRRSLLLPGACLAAFLVVSAPYFIHIRVRTGHWGLTAQMDNTSITRQILLFGGGRYDRDRLKGENLSPVVSDEDKGLSRMVKLGLGLAKKALANMFASYYGGRYSSYGLDGGKRLGPFFLALVAVSFFSIWMRFRKGDRVKSFLDLYLVAWFVQLWVLYSLITPYMVDERYMYPVMFPALMLAALGAESAARAGSGSLSGSSSEKAGRAGPPGVFPLISACFYLAAVVPVFVHHEVRQEFPVLWRHPGGLFFFHLGAAICFFALAWLGPFKRFSESRKLSPGGWLVLFGGAAVISAGAFLIPARGWGLSGFAKYLPAELLAGAALASLLSAVALRFQLSRQGSFYLLAGLIAASGFMSNMPDYLHLRFRRSARTLANKYASGHKEVAGELKKLGLVKPGKVICSRKPFMAYYLNGKWYMNKERREPIPKTIPEVKKLVASGAIDYLVADSFTFKALRPYLMPLVFGRSPLPGARLIYSKFLNRYQRIITVYDCRQEEPALPSLPPAEHLRRAEIYYQSANLPLAYREAKAALEKDPDNKRAWFIRVQALQIFYNIARRKDYPSMLTNPDLLPELVQSLQEYAKRNPRDRALKALAEKAAREYENEVKIIEKMMKEREKRKKEKAP